MRAIISDVHSNIEALEAVLADIAEHKVEEILCLGDVVGYGPNPEEAIDLIEQRCRITLSGNHDYAVLTTASRFNALAREAINFTRQVLKPDASSTSRKHERWKFIEGLPVRNEESDVLCVHGSPRDERNEYILESDAIFGSRDKIRGIFALTPRLLFVGHTHVPGIIGEDYGFWYPEGDGATFECPPEKKYIINVGSIGQPRDGNNRACYVLIDDSGITYRRVPYDFEKTIKKLSHVGPISVDVALRLAYGH